MTDDSTRGPGNDPVDPKQEAKRTVLGLLQEVVEIIHKHGLSDEFRRSWMAETESLVYPPTEDKEDLTMRTTTRLLPAFLLPNFSYQSGVLPHPLNVRRRLRDAGGAALPQTAA